MSGVDQGATVPSDFSKLQFSEVVDTAAGSLTEALVAEPSDSGFLILTCKSSGDSAAFLVALRAFVANLRSHAQDSGLTDVSAYRQVRRDELGGVVPFDQPVCEALLDRAARGQADSAPVIGVESIVLNNPRADWIIFLEYSTPDAAQSASRELTDELGELAEVVSEHTVGSFANKHRYSRIPYDPDVIHFFNLFPGPGDVDVLWPAWEKSLPWFFDATELRSSFPLVALDPQQPLLLVNCAHFDSAKHFIRGAMYDPEFMELLKENYFDKGVVPPTPFFCKLVPV